MMRRILFLVVAGFASLLARADDPPSTSGTAPVINPAAVQQHYQQVLARPEFREPDELAADFPLRDWFSQWVSHLVSKFQDFKYAGQMSGLAWLLVTTMTALALVGLIYVLIRLSRRKRDPAIDREETARGEKTFLAPRVYDEKLRQAIESRDWHAAWLATWLQFLSRLELRRMVDADRSRTNREYLAQLRAQQLPSSALPLLAGLVDDYDRFVYGLRTIDEPVWRTFRQQIDEVSLMLHLRERTLSSPAPEEHA
jgi:hypothetical protein